MAKVELQPVSITAIDISCEVSIVECIVVDIHVVTILHEVDMNRSEIHAPLNVIGDVVVSTPVALIVIVHPVACAGGIAIGIAQEANLRVGGIVVVIIIIVVIILVKKNLFL